MLSEVLSMSVNLNVELLDINTRGHLQQYLFNVLFCTALRPQDGHSETSVWIITPVPVYLGSGLAGP